MPPTPTDPRPLDPALRDAEAPLPPRLRQSLFDEIAAETVDAPPRWRTRLSERPTAVRVVLAALGLLGLPGAVAWLFGLRPDLHTLTPDETWRLGLAGVVCALAGVGAAHLTLRAAHARPLHERAWILGILYMLYPMALSVAPGWWPGHLPEAGAPWGAHLGCMVSGLVAGLLASGLVLLFDRTGRPRGWRLAGAAGAGGLVGYMTSGLHCPLAVPTHLVLAHATGGLILWAVLALGSQARR